MSTQDLKHWIRTELWEHVPVNIAVIDNRFNVVEANRNFEKTFGVWRGKPCYEVYKGRSERCVQCAASTTFADGMTRVRQEQGVNKDGEQTFYLVHIVPLVRADGGVPFIIEMSTDITETKRLEQEKLQAERLAVVGQTVAGLAHGVKNVLTGLDGGMYMARTGIKKGDVERMLTGWQILEENIARISSLVKEFLEFAKGRTPEVSLVDPNRIAMQVVDLFKDTASLIGVRLELDLGLGIAPAPMDEEGIHTCLTNLVSNALDACEISEVQGCIVVVRTYDLNGTLYFEVEDNGMGMDYEIAKKVFTNFFSTKGSGKGTGLGLLTTSKIIQEHGGRVSFDSKKGEGSVFRLELPRDRLPQLDPKEMSQNSNVEESSGASAEHL